MSEEKKASTRRGFLVGLLAGVGALAAMGGAKEAGASPKVGPQQIPDPILYRRTKEAVRYYRTLYY